MRRRVMLLLPLILLEGPRLPGRDPVTPGEARALTATLALHCEAGNPGSISRGSLRMARREINTGMVTRVQGPIWRCDGARIEMIWCSACLEPIPMCQGICLIWCECKWTPGWYCEGLPRPVWCPYGERCLGWWTQ